MLIWRGWGWLVAIGTFLLALLAQVVVEGLGGEYTESDYLPPTVVLIAGIGNFVLGRRLNGEPARVLVDENTGERVELKRRHDFFFLRMEWWGIAMVVAAAIWLIANVT